MSLPCKLCREKAMGATSDYCKDCYGEVWLELYRFIYPVSVKELEDKYGKGFG